MPKSKLDELLAQAGPISRRYCKVCHLLETLNDSDRESLEAAMANRLLYTTNGITRVIREHLNCDVSRPTVDRHRNGDCRD
jgi:hypothetical protein